MRCVTLTGGKGVVTLAGRGRCCDPGQGGGVVTLTGGECCDSDWGEVL